jgi:hypothetical protein
MDIWTSAFLFVAGILAYKIGSYLLMYGKRVAFFNDSAFVGLRMFKFVNDSIENLNKLKYNEMEKQGMKKEKIFETMKEDDDMLSLWRDIAVNGIKQMLPSGMRTMLNFTTWDQAMRLLSKRDNN